MCTSSTAAPAATGGSSSGAEERNASAGRSRLPPASRAPRPDLGDDARVMLDGSRELRLDLGEVAVEPGRRAHDLESRHGRVPTCSATIPPPRRR